MTDFMIKLPSNFQYVYQFEPGKSTYRCVEATLVMAGQIAYPDRYKNLSQLMSSIYEKYVGPDVSGDRNGTTREQALDWLHSQSIGFIDYQPLIDAGEISKLHDLLTAMNKQNVAQIISIGDESFLKYAKNVHTLHNWADSENHGSHTMLRVGFSDSEGWGYYYEPAAAPNFAEPVPIEWQNFLDGKVVGCIAIMPHGVSVPPEGIHFDWANQPWPAPKPKFDPVKAENTIAAIQQALDAMKAAMGNLANDLSVLKEEV